MTTTFKFTEGEAEDIAKGCAEMYRYRGWTLPDGVETAFEKAVLQIPELPVTSGTDATGGAKPRRNAPDRTSDDWEITGISRNGPCDSVI